MNLLKNLYKKIFYIGKENYENVDDLRIHVLVTHLYLLGALIFFVLGITNFQYKFHQASYMEFATSFIIGLGYFTQFKPLNRLVLNGLFIVVQLNLIIYDYFLDLQETNFAFVGVIIQIVIIIFFRRHKLDLFWNLFLICAVQITLAITPKHPMHKLVSDEMETEIFYTNMIFSFLLLFTLMMIIMNFWSKNRNELNAKIKEKEVLLAEVNHRVRNNLNVIISLMKLQQASIDSEESQKVLEESKQRVYSMASVHNKLYDSDNLSLIDVQEYVRDLSDEIQYNFGKDFDIQIETNNINLEVSKAIPIGLILNELFTNSFKYCKNENTKEEIQLVIKEDKQEVSLLYRDNGQFFDLEKMKSNPDSLGITIIESLSDQIDATHSFEEDAGFRFDLKFAQLN